MRRAALLCASGLVFGVVSMGSAQEVERQNPVVPVYQEPHHRQVFQHGPMRILDLQLPPGDISWFHSHESPVLYVTLGTSRTRTQNLGEDWGGRGARAGGAGRGTAPAGAPAPTPPAAAATPPAPRATSTTSYAQQPVTHRLQNIGDGLFRAMVVVNETPGDEVTTEAAAGFDARPELTNRWFRAYRLVLEPGQKTAAHVHKAPVAMFQATAGKALGAGAMTWEFNEPGQWAFFDAGDRHDVRNAGDGRVELIEVEVRGR
jgi:quercetin dioxygenase-like cupin family protein